MVLGGADLILQGNRSTQINLRPVKMTKEVLWMGLGCMESILWMDGMVIIGHKSSNSTFVNNQIKRRVI